MLAIFLGPTHSYISTHTNEYQMTDHQLTETNGCSARNCFKFGHHEYLNIPVVDRSFSFADSFTECD